MTVVTSEVNMVEEPFSWWIDCGATVHICNIPSVFKDFKMENGQQVSMGNGSLADVRGKGTVEINFTSGKKLTLKNTLFVPDIKKNLISVDLLDMAGFQITVAS